MARNYVKIPYSILKDRSWGMLPDDQWRKRFIETFLSDLPPIGEPRETKEAYKKYLNSFHWKRVRYRKLLEIKFCCESCGAKNNLSVHHLTYENIGREKLDDLQVLCSSCHRKAHGKDKS